VASSEAAKNDEATREEMDTMIFTNDVVVGRRYCVEGDDNECINNRINDGVDRGGFWIWIF